MYLLWEWRGRDEVRRLKGVGETGVSLRRMDGLEFFAGRFGRELHVRLKRRYKGKWVGKVVPGMWHE